MRVLALETDVAKIKKQFIVEGEEELLCSRHHIFSFLFPLLAVILLTLIVAVGSGLALAFQSTLFPYVMFFWSQWIFICLYQLIKAWIAWRYNFLIVTTEKIVIVTHLCIFHQEIHPLHFENIRSIRTESQYFGIGNCGTLFVTLEEKTEGGDSQNVSIFTLPKPAIIGGMIENSTVLKKQRVPVDPGPIGQEQKVVELKEKVIEEIKEESNPPPVQP